MIVEIFLSGSRRHDDSRCKACPDATVSGSYSGRSGSGCLWPQKLLYCSFPPFGNGDGWPGPP